MRRSLLMLRAVLIGLLLGLGLTPAQPAAAADTMPDLGLGQLTNIRI